MTTGAKWWRRSYNPIAGCSPVSPGCSHCWAARMAATRLAHLPAYKGVAYFDDSGEREYGPHWTGEVRVNEAALAKGPPSMRSGVLFVCDMADLGHESVSPAWRAEILSKLEALPPGVTPVVLTKRPARLAVSMLRHVSGRERTAIWCGTTVEDQRRADERLPVLRETPCAGRFLSCEPLLGPLELDLEDISWVIVGGEAGPGARPCDAGWFRDIVRQCRAAGVPVWGKQLGSCVLQRTPDPHETGPAALALDHEWPDGTVFGNPTGRPALNGRVVRLRQRAGSDMSEWPPELRVREKPGGVACEL